MHTDACNFQGQELFSAPDTRAGSIASLPSLLHAVRGFRIYVHAQARPVNCVTMPPWKYHFFLKIDTCDYLWKKL